MNDNDRSSLESGSSTNEINSALLIQRLRNNVVQREGDEKNKWADGAEHAVAAIGAMLILLISLVFMMTFGSRH